MYSRAIRILLLVTFAYWATGLGRYVHERLEHDHGSERAASARAAARPAGTSGFERADVDDHDDCLICQMLAAMSAERGVPPAAPAAHVPCVGQVLPAPRLAPIQLFVPYLPARGPPSA